MEVSPNIHTSECDSGTGSVCSDYLEEVETEKFEVVKKMIKPDVSVMTKLLNFNEEDEDDLTDTDDDETNEKIRVSPHCSEGTQYQFTDRVTHRQH